MPKEYICPYCPRGKEFRNPLLSSVVRHIRFSSDDAHGERFKYPGGKTHKEIEKEVEEFTIKYFSENVIEPDIHTIADEVREVEEIIERSDILTASNVKTEILERIRAIEDEVNELSDRLSTLEDMYERIADLEKAIKSLKNSLLKLIEILR